jgi:signal transduction histidine kinase
MQTDPKFLPWRAEAVKRGYSSSLVLPLRRKQTILGAITIYAKDPEAFNENDVQLLTELAGDLAFGIENMRLRAEHAQADAILKRDKDTIEQLAQEKSLELIKTQQELDKAKRLSDIGFLAATVAHELRNPLAAITLAAANIKRKAQQLDIGTNLTTIGNKIVESNQIINNLLFYSKLRPPRLQSVAVHRVLGECINEVEKQYPQTITVTAALTPIRDVQIQADPLQLKEVFANVLNNAFDAVDENSGKIEVRAEAAAAVVRIDVQDNGSGITQEDLEKIFDPFFTTKAKGTGLGLTICSQIVKLHGGHIDIDSHIKQGTTLIITLPRGE